jgi:hypothetical protein
MQRRNDALEDEAVGLRHRILSKVPIRPHRMSGAPMARAGTKPTRAAGIMRSTCSVAASWTEISLYVAYWARRIDLILLYFG